MWFSSDTSPTGGVTPGSPWFDQLVSRIEASEVFLALVTPTSIENLWLHYETGCAATKRIPIVPIVAGVSVSDVRLPLSLYNAYNISQPESLKTLLVRLFDAQKIRHDELMLETPVRNAVQQINSVLEENYSDQISDNDGGAGKILRLIDKRFMDLINQLSHPETAEVPAYSVSAAVTKAGKEVSRISIDISAEDSLGDVSHALYFKIQKYVSPFSYLVEWLVRDRTLGVDLIMRDFLDSVAASAVIKPGHEYEVVLLSSPFDPTKPIQAR